MAGHRLHTLVDDARRSLRGLAAMARWGAQRDDLALALASFRARSVRAHPGETSTYELALTNCGPVDVVVRVLIDCYRRDDPTHPNGHYGFFQKTLLAGRKRMQRIAITYDWQRSARFDVDGVSLAADVVWRGTCDRPGTYDLYAVLLSLGAAPAQRLHLVQELA